YGPVHGTRVADAGGTRGVVIDTTDAKLGGIVGCDGLFSTAADVATLAQRVLDGTIPGAQEMSTDQTVGGVPPDADHDWESTIWTGPKSIGWEIPTPHAYGAGYAYCKAGISGTFVCVDPSSALVAVYLTNLGMPAGDDLQPWYTALAPDQVFAAI